MYRFQKIFLIGSDFVENDVHLRLLNSMNIADKLMLFNNALDPVSYLQLTSFSPKDKTGSSTNLVIIDFKMPGMDAWYFMALFKSVCVKIIPYTKIIIISESFGKKDLEQIKSEALVHAYIQKPLTADKINECFKHSSGIPTG